MLISAALRRSIPHTAISSAAARAFFPNSTTLSILDTASLNVLIPPWTLRFRQIQCFYYKSIDPMLSNKYK